MPVLIVLLFNFENLYQVDLQGNKIKGQNEEEIKDKMCVSKYRDVIVGAVAVLHREILTTAPLLFRDSVVGFFYTTPVS